MIKIKILTKKIAEQIDATTKENQLDLKSGELKNLDRTIKLRQEELNTLIGQRSELNKQITDLKNEPVTPTPEKQDTLAPVGE